MDNTSGSTGGTPERPRDETPRDDSAISGGASSTPGGGEGLGSGSAGEEGGALYRPAYGAGETAGGGPGADAGSTSSGFGGGGEYSSGSASSAPGDTPSEGGARAYSTPGEQSTPPSGGAGYTPYTPPPSSPTTPTGDYGSIGEGARAAQPPYTPPGEPTRAMPYEPPAGAAGGYQGAPPYGSPGAPGAPGMPPQGYTPPPGQYQQGYPQQPPQFGQPPYPQQGYPQQGQGQGYPPPGYPQQQGGYGPPPPTYQAPPAQKSGVPVIVWIIGGVLLATILGCVLVFWMVSNAVGTAVNTTFSRIGNELGGFGPYATSIGFTTSMTFGNYDDAHNYLSGDLANRYSADTLEQRWEALSTGEGSLGVENSLGDVETLDANRSSVDWTVTTPNGDETIQLIMEPQGDEWKIVEARPDLLP